MSSRLRARVEKSLNHKNKFEDHNFHVIIAPVLALAQFFGFFPFIGVFAKNVKNVMFKWKSIRVVHSLFWLFSAVAFTFLELLRLSREGKINPKNINGLIFYLHGFVGGLLFFHLAKQWPAILQSFTKVEGILQTEAYAYSDGWQIKKKIRMTSLVLFSVAFSEHFISWINFLYDRLTQAKLCKWQIDNYFYYLAYHHLYQVYQELPLNPFTVAWGEYMNVSFAFAWSFIDLFVILVSMGISSMFMKINKRLEFFHGRIVNDNFWEEIRVHYNAVCELQELLDEKIGSIVCLACLNDLYFICLQLLNVATPVPFVINSIYFWCSLIYLLARTSAMFFIASSINDESRKPLKILRTIPSEGWFSEAQRFSHQVQSECIAMSGKKFFFITRGIIISIAGTIVTYELVLLQFNGNAIVSDMFHPCPVPPIEGQ